MTHRSAAKLPRLVAVGLPALVVIGVVAVIVPKVLDDDAAAGQVFTSTTRQVTYEVLGSGRSEEITYTSGENNTERTVRNAKLPWRLTVDVPVGVAGGTANLIARNPANDTTVTCRISMSGKALNEVAATDGYVDPSCAVPLAPERAK